MNRNCASDKAFSVCHQALQAHGYHFTAVKRQRTIRFLAGGEHGDYQVLIRVTNEQPIVQCHSIAGLRVPEGKRVAIAELLTRINYDLCVDNFEMSYTDGQVRFKTSVALRDGELTEQMALALVQINLTLMDEFFLAMTQVIYSNAEPQAADRQIRGSLSPRPLPWEISGQRRFG